MRASCCCCCCCCGGDVVAACASADAARRLAAIGAVGWAGIAAASVDALQHASTTTSMIVIG